MNRIMKKQMPDLNHIMKKQQLHSKRKKKTIKKKIIYECIEITLFSDLDLSFLKTAFLSVKLSEAIFTERKRVPRGGRKRELSHRNLLKEQTNKWRIRCL